MKHVARLNLVKEIEHLRPLRVEMTFDTGRLTFAGLAGHNARNAARNASVVTHALRMNEVC
jgi:hypothetical protein